jgi:o-succinylbenzoate synthase
MTIDRIELRHIRMPFVLPFETAGGSEDHKDCILVRAWAGGISGWGESPVPMTPFYMEETVETAWPIMTRFLGPRMLGRPFTHPGEVGGWLRPIRRHRLAKSGLEAAAWDLYARAHGISLAQALGGTQTRVPVGISVGIERTIDATLRRIETWLADGYRRIKAKIKPGWDVEVVAAIRGRFDDIPLQVDANAAYTLRDVSRLQALDAYTLVMIEQPLDADDLVDHAALQRELRTPVCLDESIGTADDARKALDLGACRIVNVKAARMGGLSEAQRCHRLCHDRGVPLWCGGLLETGVGRAANIALASLPGFTLPADLGASRRYFQEDVIDPEVEVAPDGTVAVPSGAGLGFTVLEPVVDRYTVRKETLRAG